MHYKFNNEINAAYQSMNESKIYKTVGLDMASEGDTDKNMAIKWAKKFKVEVNTIKKGPNWPMVSFKSEDKNKLMKLLKDYFGDDEFSDKELDEMIK